MRAIAQYYAEKLARHGASPLGVDWSCEPSQHFRFVQLLKICGDDRDFSLNDIGCGYGALLPFLDARFAGRAIRYHGVDICEPMIAAARRMWVGRPDAKFDVAGQAPSIADYSVASGVFNVKLHFDNTEWEALVADGLASLSRKSGRGFAVNFVDATGYDPSKRQELYRVDPDRWARYCTTHLDRVVEIVSNYGMREFTLLARTR